MNNFSKKGLLAFSTTNAILFCCLFCISSGAIADNVVYDFNVSYSNIYEKEPNTGDKFSDIHINAKAQVACVDSDSDFSNPQFEFESTRMALNLSDSTLVGGPYPTTPDFSGGRGLFLDTHYSLEHLMDDEISIHRTARIVLSILINNDNDGLYYHFGNAQEIRNLTETQYNNLRQMLLDEDPLSFINQFISMNQSCYLYIQYFPV